MLHVGMDARTLARENPRGIGRYVRSVIEHVCLESDDVRFTLFYDADQVRPAVAQCPRVSLAPFRFRGDRWSLWERIGLPLHAMRAGVDVLHCAANTAPSWQPRPTVITVHDTILWDEPSEAGLTRSYAGGPLARAVRRAAKIITISESSRRDIVERFPAVCGRLAVIPHGLDCRFREPVPADVRGRMRKEFGLVKRYVLYAGGAAARKRADWALRLTRAWLDQTGADVVLALLGFSDQPQGAVLDEARRLSIENHIVLLPSVPEDLMPALYAECEFMVYPSIREGFGFPPLEAQACGKAILLSSTSSLPEVSGPAAILLPPLDWDAWVRAGVTLLTTPSSDAQSEASRLWAKQFQWSDAAKRTLAIYCAVAESRS